VSTFAFSALKFLQKHEFYISQGNIDALFRWGGKHFYYHVANILRRTCI